MRVLVVNGPNLNLLGVRRPEVYGHETLSDLEARCAAWGTELGMVVETYQSNHEGAIIDRLHAALGTTDGIVINPGALTHYSYALHDAIDEKPEIHLAHPGIKRHNDAVAARGQRHRFERTDAKQRQIPRHGHPLRDAT